LFDCVEAFDAKNNRDRLVGTVKVNGSNAAITVIDPMLANWRYRPI